MKNHIIYLLIIMVFIMTFAYSFDGDRDSDLKPINEIDNSTLNQKIYDPSREEVTVKDPLGLTTVGTVRLLSPKHNVVGLGYQMVAEFEITSNINDSDFLKKMYFYDIKDSYTPIQRSYDIREAIDYTEEVPITETTCTISDKNIEDCVTKETAKQTIQKTRYELYSEKSINTGTKRLSVWVQIDNEGDYKEWIPDILGVAMPEFADWNSDFNAQMRSYWKFDSSTSPSVGKTPDSINGFNNGTIDGATLDNNGLFVNDFYYDTSTDNIRFDGNTWKPDKNFTVNVWVKTASVGGTRVMSHFITGSTNYGFILDCGGTGNSPRFGIGDGTDFVYASDTNASNNCDSNNWRMLTGTYDGNAVKLYVDGRFVKDATQSGIVQYQADSRFGTGAIWNGAAYVQSFTGFIDEGAVWERVLTPTDVNYLFDGGRGMTYTPTPLAITSTRITFNVFRKGTATHLTGVNLDSNVNTLDLSLQNSPFSTIFVDRFTSADGNFTRTGYDSNFQILYFDSNKTTTVFLSDTTAPIVGQTQVTGFTLNGNRISGTGTISATATDSGSGINTTTCEYTVNGGTSWLPATDYNGTHCRKTSYTVPATGSFTFNMRVRDDANNTGTGTQTIAYLAGTFIFVHVRDENTGLDLNDVRVNFDGSNYDFNSTIDFNMTALTNTQTYTMTFTKTGYGTRYYTFDLNNAVDLNVNFLLLPTSLGSDLTYKIYDANGLILKPNTYFQMNRPDRNNYIIGRRITDGSAVTTIFTNVIDQNYTQLIGDQNTYQMVALSVLRPKNEQTLAVITEQWQVTMTGNRGDFDTNLTGTFTIYMIPNIVSTYNLQIVDVNGNYFPRNYSMAYKGNPLTDTLQPYLASVSAATLLPIISQSSFTIQRIPFVDIKIYKILAGGRTLIDEVITSSSGNGSTYLIFTDTYYFDVYYQGNFMGTLTVSGLIPGQTYYVKIGDTNTDLPLNNSFAFGFSYIPLNQQLHSYDTNLIQIINLYDQNSSMTVSGVLFQVINTDVNGTSGNNSTIYQDFISNPDFNLTHWIEIDPINHDINGVSYDENGALRITITIITSDGNITNSFTYIPYGGIDIVQNLGFDLRPFFGCTTLNPITGEYDPNLPCPTMMLLALFIAIIIAVTLTISTGFANLSTTGFIFLLVLGFFAWITWIPYIIYGLIFVATLGLVIAEGGRRV